MRLQLETMSPVHIGSGAEIPPSEYWFDAKAGQVCRLNLESLVQDQAFLPHLEKFVREAAQGGRQVDRYVPQEVLASHARYELPALGEARGHLAQHPTVIKAQVLSGGRAFIPGSSIKGSLLSAVLWGLLKGEAKTRPGFQDDLARALAEKDRRESARQHGHLLGRALGRFCRGQPDRFAKWLSVSDTNLISPRGHLAVVLVEVTGARRGDHIPVLMEVLRPEVTLEFNLDFPAGTCQHASPMMGLDKLLELADTYYRRVWEKTATAPPPTDGWLLRLGQGSGAWATSMLLLAEDLGLSSLYHVSAPATRKMVDSRDPMGWAVLTPAGEAAAPPFPLPGQVVRKEIPIPEAEAPPQPVGPSAKLTELLARLKGAKPHDAGRVAAFLDGAAALEDQAEKAELARAILRHFNRKTLKKHKRWTELEHYDTQN